MRKLCFNSQPPEGGWRPIPSVPYHSSSFNSQPPEGGWPVCFYSHMEYRLFQLTAARRRLGQKPRALSRGQSFNSQPPEGGWPKPPPCLPVGTPFQLTAARRRLAVACYTLDDVAKVSTHSRPKAAGLHKGYGRHHPYQFQLTAARRRLGKHQHTGGSQEPVSTHSRPKAAG